MTAVLARIAARYVAGVLTELAYTVARKMGWSR